MKKTLVLLAGYPATGKTYLMDCIMERHPGDFAVTTPDEIKEQVWDEYGFDNAAEKDALELLVWERYYDRLETYMAQGRQVLSDYPFSEKQRPRLSQMADCYGYRVLTIRSLGDPEVLYARSYARDMKQSRHLGHLVSRYRKGDVLEDRSQADALVTREVFLDRCQNKGYQHFCLGSLIEVDATDVKAIDYESLLDNIDAALAA